MSDFCLWTTPCEACFERSDRIFASKISYISWAKQESGQCSSRSFGSWGYHGTAMLAATAAAVVTATSLTALLQPNEN